MTEAEWLASADAKAMLEAARGRASPRKLRLLAVACYRSIWPLVERGMAEGLGQWAARFDQPADELRARLNAWREHNQRALDIAERWSDGPVAPEEVRYLEEYGGAPFSRLAFPDSEAAARAAVPAVPDYVAYFKAQPVGHERLVRDVLGNPFRPARIDPGWAAWDGGTIPRLAQAIYDGPRFEGLPVLADALEDAGCTEEAILSHLRGPGPHVRGCWALDLLLGKE
jgi:hypothetical protein